MSLLDKKKTLTDHYFTVRIFDRGTYRLAYTVNNGEILRVEKPGKTKIPRCGYR